MVEALLRHVSQNLNTLIQNELRLELGVGEEMEKLSITLSKILDVIEDAEAKVVKEKAVRNLVGKLKDVAYDVEDILEECASKAKAESTRGWCGYKQVLTSYLSLSCCQEATFHRKIKEMREKIDEIVMESSNFHFKKGVVDIWRKVAEMPPLPTTSFLADPQVYGREEDKKKMVESVVKEREGVGVSIYPIIGVGGIGKTTLARLAYNDERVKKHFEIRAWVSVSQDFDEPKLVHSILESVCGKPLPLGGLGPMKRSLLKELSGKRFLLVLDDIWNEDADEWGRLKHLLSWGHNGSTIIVTTRIEKVGLMMGTLPAHYLEGLSQEHYWSLFKQHAFGIEIEEELPELVAICEEIANKCAGVPIAAKTLGSVMRFKREETEWLSIRDSEIWEVEDENAILPALRLSYNHLPSHLKQCFSYCFLFPKSYEIDKEKLIHLWMANDFVPSTGRFELEDIGHGIFHDLLSRSFFQDVKKDEDGNIIKCKMHDLIHDLARSIVRDEFYISEASSAENALKKLRHSSLIRDERLLLSIPGALYKAQTLRTFIFTLEIPYIGSGMNNFPRNIFSHCKCLRVLDLSRTQITHLSHSISNLLHLRYLNLSATYIKTLPETMGRLQNLQTLILANCYLLSNLPSDMRKMTSLRYLDIDGCCRLTHMPAMIRQLSSLKILPSFVVGKNTGSRIGELQGLNLRGQLEIWNLDNVRGMEEAKEANLIGKRNLRSLKLFWQCDGDSNNSQRNDEEVLQGLQPHHNLEYLMIAFYAGIEFPSWVMNFVLPNLVEISFNTCTRCEHLPSLGLLPLLKVLRLKRMDAVRYIGYEFYGDCSVVAKTFPSLKELHFAFMPNLEEWFIADGKEIELFPCLITLTVEQCPKLRMLPCLPSLQNLLLWRSNPSILRSVANLTRLSSLTINSFNEVGAFPRGMLRNLTLLKELFINYCHELETLSGELDNLVALESLQILICEGLVSLPNGLRNLSSLQKLNIWGCFKLTSLPEQGIRGLCSLRDMNIEKCDDLRSLSEGLQYLTALQCLRISDCPEMDSLPMGMEHLTALRSLDILDCPKLMHLPQGLQQLPTLHSIRIERCPGLTALPEWHGNLASLRYLCTWEYDNSTSSQPEEPQRLAALQSPGLCYVPELVHLPQELQHSTTLEKER